MVNNEDLFKKIIGHCKEYRFIFQSYQKTLSDDEINTKVQEIINPVIELDGVSIQGM